MCAYVRSIDSDKNLPFVVVASRFVGSSLDSIKVSAARHICLDIVRSIQSWVSMLKAEVNLLSGGGRKAGSSGDDVEKRLDNDNCAIG